MSTLPGTADRNLAEDRHHRPEHLNDLAATQTELAILQPAEGWETAILNYEEAASVRRRLAKANSDNPAYRLDFCRPLLNQAPLLRRGRREEARRAPAGEMTPAVAHRRVAHRQSGAPADGRRGG